MEELKEIEEIEESEEKKKPTAESIIKTLFAERDSYKQANQSQRTEFSEIYDAYIGKMADNKDRSKSQEKVMKLRTEVSYIVPQIFSGKPEIEVEPVGAEDKDFAYVAEKIINYRFDTISQFYEKIEAWVKQATVFGTSLIRPTWIFETREVEDGIEEPSKDEPGIDVPNILDSFYNPIIPEVDCQNSIIFRSVLPLDEVKENPIYDYKDENGVLNREKVASGGSANANQYDSSRQLNSDLLDQSKATEGTIEVYERITHDRIQTVCDGKERLVLRDIANPDEFVPTVKLIHEPNAIPNRFEGFGVGQNTYGLSKIYQKMLNRTLDNVAFGNNPHFLGQKGMGLDKSQLVTKAGGITEVDTGGQPLGNFIQPLPVPDIKQGSIEIMNKIEDEHKRASGANDMMQGAASNKTLGQDQIASTYSSNRFELITRRFKQALSTLAEMILKMELSRIQSIDAPILRIFPLEAESDPATGNPQYSRETVYLMLISEQAKDAKFNIRVKGNTNVAKNKDLQIRQLMEAYNIFGAILPPQNQMEFARKILELRGIDEIDKLIPDPEEFAQQQQEAQMGQMMPEGPAQGMEAGLGGMQM